MMFVLEESYKKHGDVTPSAMISIDVSVRRKGESEDARSEFC